VLFPDKLIVLSEETKKFIESPAPWFKCRIVKIVSGVSSDFRPPQPAERVKAGAEFGYDEADFAG
jgi:hypothetical protein